MVGLIWLIQIVHYPLMNAMSVESRPAYARSHAARITPVVAAGMLTEAAAAAVLLFGLPGVLSTLGVIAVAMIWSSTLFIQVPLHRSLMKANSEQAHARLVRSNWIRTGLWTFRGIASLMMFSL